MNLQQQSRNEYIHRINRVVDYIEAHLDDEHSLETLSQVAHFSPFHFHRIFKALTGETVNNYVKRIRLQKAGSMLITDYQRSDLKFQHCAVLIVRRYSAGHLKTTSVKTPVTSENTIWRW